MFDCVVEYVVCSLEFTAGAGRQSSSPTTLDTDYIKPVLGGQHWPGLLYLLSPQIRWLYSPISCPIIFFPIQAVGLQFNTVVFDCEGCYHSVVRENIETFRNIHKIILEWVLESHICVRLCCRFDLAKATATGGDFTQWADLDWPRTKQTVTLPWLSFKSHFLECPWIHISLAFLQAKFPWISSNSQFLYFCSKSHFFDFPSIQMCLTFLQVTLTCSGWPASLPWFLHRPRL